MKNNRDIQAEADLRSEEVIIKKIKTAFPSHSIFAKESGEEINESEYLWAVDPLDGTINYSRGIEEFCISIASAGMARLSRDSTSRLAASGAIHSQAMALLKLEEGSSILLTCSKD